MRINVLLFAAMLAQAQVPAAESIAAGKKLFATYCSVGYCHGSEGRAGRGPRLRDREWDRAYLFKAINEGIPNSSMPGWRDKLSNDQMRSIVAYILSISKEIVQTGAQPEPSTPQPAVSAAVAPGKNLFFDFTNDRNCGVCHKVAGVGGDVGPDLSKLASQPAREILKRILLSRETSNRKPIELTTKDGETLRGILVEENASGFRVYDLGSPGPPVLRSLNIADIASRRPVDLEIAHENLAATYTLKQWLDIVAYLKSPETPVKVRLEDLF